MLHIMLSWTHSFLLVVDINDREIQHINQQQADDIVGDLNADDDAVNIDEHLRVLGLEGDVENIFEIHHFNDANHD